MRIAFYAPFKPLGHPQPSGDLAIARGIVEFLEKQGHDIEIQSALRARWIYFKPWMWLQLLHDFIVCVKKLHRNLPDVWLTYHTYYKAPDLLGPWVCRILGIKYVVFQGIYSTKRKRRFKTIMGYYLNTAALKRAAHVFTNKLTDLENLKRIIPLSHLTYIKPGIQPDGFLCDEGLGKANRKKWGIRVHCPVILTAAMFRDDVKTKGLVWLINCCAGLVRQNIDFHLVIAGSGKMEKELKCLARNIIPGHHTFAGKIKREKMGGFYSAGDVFAFPGIRESLGMVYLEAQACSLPVVAFRNGGIPEVVADKITGFLVPMYDSRRFSDRLIHLLTDEKKRRHMGTAAAAYVRAHHDLERNYAGFENKLIAIGSPGSLPGFARNKT